MARTIILPAPERPADQCQDPASQLVRVRTLEDLTRQRQYQPDSSPVRFSEYKLPILSLPSSNSDVVKNLREFVDLFWSGVKHDDYRYIWIGDALMRLEGSRQYDGNGLEAHSMPKKFGLFLNAPNGTHLSIYIHSQMPEDAVKSMEFLLRLPDDYFTRILVKETVAQPTECPLSEPAFRKTLKNETREIVFENFEFTANQCLAVISCEADNRVSFLSCRFLLGPNIKFASNVVCGPVKLTLKMEDGQLFMGSKENWVSFLNSDSLESLKICETNISDPTVCQAISRAPAVRELDLDNVGMVDTGVSLITEIQQGRGPKSLILSSGSASLLRVELGMYPFMTIVQWQSFLDSLGATCQVERFKICRIGLRGDEWLSLACALEENTHLCELTLSHVKIGETSWDSILGAISGHPRLSVLNLKIYRSHVDLNEPLNLHKQEQRTRVVRDMLLSNIHIDTMPFDGQTYDREKWDLLVVPLLQRNLYRKRYESIQNITGVSLRSSVIGAALGAVGENLSLVWMMLSMNQDVIADSLLSRKREDFDAKCATVSRKRTISASCKV